MAANTSSGAILRRLPCGLVRKLRSPPSPTRTTLTPVSTFVRATEEISMPRFAHALRTRSPAASLPTRLIRRARRPRRESATASFMASPPVESFRPGQGMDPVSNTRGPAPGTTTSRIAAPMTATSAETFMGCASFRAQNEQNRRFMRRFHCVRPRLTPSRQPWPSGPFSDWQRSYG